MTLKRKLSIALMLLAALAAVFSAAPAATPEDYDPDEPQLLEADHLYAESAFLMDMDTGEVLLSKDSRVRVYPASTTKIMTLILALESDIALSDQVTIPKEADKVPQGSSVIGIKSGDVMTWEDLLYGFMLRSGNDGSNAIAVLTAGSIDAFVQRMNEKAQALGCEGTQFVNAHGYHDEAHYTTAQDLARMSLYGMQNEVFRQIVGCARREITVTRGGKTRTAEVENRNSLVVPDSNYYYSGANGIKTGHHNKAGRCVVASAERAGVRLLAVVMDCSTEEKQFNDAKKLFNYGYSQYSQYSMAELLSLLRLEIATVTIENASESDPGGGTLMLLIGDIQGGDAGRMIQRNSKKAMTLALDDIRSRMSVEWTRPLVAPVAAGEVLGSVRFTTEAGEPVSAQLIAPRAVEEKPEPTPTLAPTPASTEESAAQVEPTAPPQARRVPSLVVLGGIALGGLVIIVTLAAFVQARKAKKRRELARRRARRRKAAAAKRGGDRSIRK